MITWMRTMLECRRSATLLEQYLDADPSAPLPAAEAERLAAHLAVCARCTRAAEQHRLLRASLRRLGDRRRPDAPAVDRLQALVRTLSTSDDDTR